MYLIEVDPGDYSKLTPHKFLVDVNSPSETWDVFWKKCIHDKGNSLTFDRLFVSGYDGFVLTPKHFYLDPFSSYRVYREQRIDKDEPFPGTINIRVTRIPSKLKEMYKKI